VLNKKQKKWLLEHFFPIYKRLFKPILLRKRFQIEKELLKGRHQPEVKEQSVILFTTFKCASTLLSKLTREFCKRSGLTNVDFDVYLSHQEEDVDKWFSSQAFLKNAFRDKGYVYGPFRSYRNIPEINNYKLLLLLRDPRDVLTSHYYSIAYSHGVMNTKLLEKRRRAKKQTVDEFVVSNYEDILNIYKEYADKLIGNKNVVYWKYEDMIARPKDFIISFANLVGANITEHEIKSIVENEFVLPEKEDVQKHRRSGKTGQYKIKLTHETINFLNHKFNRVLLSLGYE
jgi:hypothetical protein